MNILEYTRVHTRVFRGFLLLASIIRVRIHGKKNFTSTSKSTSKNTSKYSSTEYVLAASIHLDSIANRNRNRLFQKAIIRQNDSNKKDLFKSKS